MGRRKAPDPTVRIPLQPAAAEIRFAGRLGTMPWVRHGQRRRRMEGRGFRRIFARTQPVAAGPPTPAQNAFEDHHGSTVRSPLDGAWHEGNRSDGPDVQCHCGRRDPCHARPRCHRAPTRPPQRPLLAPTGGWSRPVESRRVAAPLQGVAKFGLGADLYIRPVMWAESLPRARPGFDPGAVSVYEAPSRRRASPPGSEQARRPRPRPCATLAESRLPYPRRALALMEARRPGYEHAVMCDILGKVGENWRPLTSGSPGRGVHPGAERPPSSTA